MTIENQSSVSIHVSGKDLLPKERKVFDEATYNSVSVLSSIGCVHIDSEGFKRTFLPHGKLLAKESEEKDKNERRVIIIFN